MYVQAQLISYQVTEQAGFPEGTYFEPGFEGDKKPQDKEKERYFRFRRWHQQKHSEEIWDSNLTSRQAVVKVNIKLSVRLLSNK